MREYITSFEKIFAQQIGFAEVYGELPSKRTPTGLPLYSNDDPGDKQNKIPPGVGVYELQTMTQEEKEEKLIKDEWSKIQQLKEVYGKDHLFLVKRGALVESKSKKNSEFFRGNLTCNVLGYIEKNEKGKKKKNELKLIKIFPNKPVIIEFKSDFSNKPIFKKISDLLDKKGREKPMVVRKKELKYYDLSKVREESDFRNLLAKR